MIASKRYGWIPDLPDTRDHQYSAPQETLSKLPASFDLRSKCPPVYNQGNLNSCTANAIAAAVQFDLMKQNDANFVPSRLFLYYNERVMAGNVNKDTGAPIRDGIKCIVRLGDCPETLWPYLTSKYAVKPPGPCYAQARKYQAVQYKRLTQKPEQLKTCLASGYPFIFGIKVYQSFESSEIEKTGHLFLPTQEQKSVGRHAVMAVGYDDSKEWLIVRNSWGDRWGIQGYFTLPYVYALNKDLSSDFWTLRVVT